MLKKHTEINSHASCITVTVRETEPHSISFMAIFFQTAPVLFFLFFFLNFLFFFHNRDGYPHIIHCKLFC